MPRASGRSARRRASRRRSKEEYLDAVAMLLLRKGDRAEAYRSAATPASRTGTAFALPVEHAPALVAEAAARYRGLSAERLLHLLSCDEPSAFVDVLRELETVRNECLAREHH